MNRQQQLVERINWVEAKILTPVAQTSNSASFSAKDVLKNVREVLFFVILKLPCIKPNAIADWTFFIPDVRLFEVNHFRHLGMTFWTIDIPDFIKLTACCRVASVYTLRALNIFERLSLH